MPLDLTLRLDHAPAALGLLLEFLPRIRSLSLAYPNERSIEDNSMWHAICALLREPAPALERLALKKIGSYMSPMIPPHELPSDFLGNKPGRLQKCMLTHVLLPRDGVCPAFAGIETFYYKPPGYNVLSPITFESILSFFTHLKSLSLDYESFELDPSRPTLPVCDLDQLHLHLHFSAAHALNFFRRARNLSVNTRDADTALAGLTLPPLVRADMDTFGSCAHFTNSGDNTLRLYALEWGQYKLLSRQTTTDLTVLNIDELQWCRAEAVPPFLRLTSFTICLASCSDQHMSYIADIGVTLSGIWQADATLVAPSLQDVSLVSVPGMSCNSHFFASSLDCCCANGCTLALDCVEVFVQNAIAGSPGKRLPRLTLAGISYIVDADLERAFTRLLNIVEEVDFAPRPPQNYTEEWRTPKLR